MFWRAVHNALPSLCNLWRRNIVSLPLCPGCQAEGEGTVHALWSCKSLYGIWESDEVVRRFFRYKIFSYADFWEMFLRMRNWLDINLIAMIFWLIQNRRNSARVGDVVLEVNQSKQKAESFLQEFLQIQGRQCWPPTKINQATRWIPPIHPQFKVNYDGAIFNNLGTAGLGVVVHDSAGKVIGSLSERVPLPTSPAVVEALACKKALSFAKELSIAECCFEGDAKIIFKAVSNQDCGNPEYGNVIRDYLSQVIFKVVFSLMLNVQAIQLPIFQLGRLILAMSYRFGWIPVLMTQLLL